jgi:aminoglycoside 3-N-acetyltransferase
VSETNEASVIDTGAGEAPVTRRSLLEDLRRLGVAEGVTLLVHSSLSRLGWVAGGEHAVVLALLDSVGPDGTLVMPTHSGHLTDPSRWKAPPVPEAWWQTIRDETPAFDSDLTQTRMMGAIVECFRHVPGVRRSRHPTVSFAATGPRTDVIVTDHQLAYGFGEESPLARLYELDAWVLLLGVGHGNNTSLHLAEYRSTHATKEWVTKASPMFVDGARRWCEWPDLEGDTDDFETMGADFAETGRQREGPAGSGRALLMRQRDVVDFATSWFATHR